MGIIKYLKVATESYERQREEIPAPIMPTDPTGLPDYTEVIDQWLNQKEQDFREAKEKIRIAEILGGFSNMESIAKVFRMIKSPQYLGCIEPR